MKEQQQKTETQVFYGNTVSQNTYSQNMKTITLLACIMMVTAEMLPFETNEEIERREACREMEPKKVYTRINQFGEKNTFEHIVPQYQQNAQTKHSYEETEEIMKNSTNKEMIEPNESEKQESYHAEFGTTKSSIAIQKGGRNHLQQDTSGTSVHKAVDTNDTDSRQLFHGCK
jgi:hypothetical protein